MHVRVVCPKCHRRCSRSQRYHDEIGPFGACPHGCGVALERLHVLRDRRWQRAQQDLQRAETPSSSRRSRS